MRDTSQSAHLVDKIGHASLHRVLEGHVGLKNDDGEEEQEKTQVRHQPAVHKHGMQTGGVPPLHAVDGTLHPTSQLCCACIRAKPLSAARHNNETTTLRSSVHSATRFKVQTKKTSRCNLCDTDHDSTSKRTGVQEYIRPLILSAYRRRRHASPLLHGKVFLRDDDKKAKSKDSYTVGDVCFSTKTPNLRKPLSLCCRSLSTLSRSLAGIQHTLRLSSHPRTTACIRTSRSVSDRLVLIDAQTMRHWMEKNRLINCAKSQAQGAVSARGGEVDPKQQADKL